MAKKINAMVKLQCPAGAATPAPPVGTALGPHGVNIMEFVKQFNARTQSQSGMVIPVVVTIFGQGLASACLKAESTSSVSPLKLGGDDECPPIYERR